MQFLCEEKAGVDLWSFAGSMRIQGLKELKDLIHVTRGKAKRKMVDFSAVDECDSAGVQLICALMIEAERQGLVLEIPEWPESILETAQVIGVKLKGIE